MPVIHRDVAQKNIMVTYDGMVKLLDFGIAKARGGANRTQVGMVKGTTGYMSPEQVRGEPLDGRSDLFAAGVMLHEMLTGQRLFAGESEIQEMRMILEAPIPSPSTRAPQVSQAVSAVVLKALARDRDQRYPNGRELARAIEAAAGPLLFDAEQRAAFLAEPFRDRREATRRLLESADEVEIPETPPQEVREALGATEDRTEMQLSAAEQDVETRVFARPEAPRPEARKPPAPPAPRRAREQPEPGDTSGVATTGRRVPGRAPEAPRAPAPPPAPVATPAPAASGRWGLIVLLLAVGLGLGIAGMKLFASHKAPELPEFPAPVAGQDLSAPKPLTVPPPKNVPPVEPSPTTPPVQAQEPGKEAPDDKTAAPAERPRPGKGGYLTLVILPEAEVFLNGRSLGKAPMFKKSVPAGQHQLRIQGADGKRRTLEVLVEVGKTAQFKLALKDIPEG